MNLAYFRSLLCPGTSVLVVGAGRSGISATNLLLQRGLLVHLCDDLRREKLHYHQNTDLIQSTHLRAHFGNFLKIPFADVKALVLSPGVSLQHPVVLKAKALGIPLLSEIDCAVIFLSSYKMVGITGTNGKSTTTVMLESIFERAGLSATACGNLGLPLSQVALNTNAHAKDYLVVELSSFQLETTRLAKLDGAIIVNITPNHLDRYESFETYAREKCNITSLLKENAPFVVNDALKCYQSIRQKTPIYFHANQIACGRLSYLQEANIVGDHNLENAAAAATLAQGLFVAKNCIVEGILRYKALPHRCEHVATLGGVTFIDDSKGTTVVSVKKALSMSKAPTHLLLGGIEKGEDFSNLREDFFPQIAAYYVYGQATHKIMAQLRSPLATPCETLEDALVLAQKRTRSGDIVLLSPGCASFDQFVDYHDRGETFKRLVNSLWSA